MHVFGVLLKVNVRAAKDHPEVLFSKDKFYRR